MLAVIYLYSPRLDMDSVYIYIYSGIYETYVYVNEYVYVYITVLIYTYVYVYTLICVQHLHQVVVIKNWACEISHNWILWVQYNTVCFVNTISQNWKCHC